MRSLLQSIVLVTLLTSHCRCEKRDKLGKDYLLLDPLEESHNTRQLQSLILRLVDKIKVQHCLAIITDRAHKEIWKKTIFRDQFRLATNFIIGVNDSEDMLNPDYKTVRSLQEIKRKNCDFIMVFLLNGIQTKRFLIFMDEHRILNTRARFIILYDHRIFSKDVHYIWRRILSVVFIRTIEGEIDFGRAFRFDLLTVPFPHILQGSFVGKNIGVWQNGKLQEKGELFYDKASNLEGLELKVAVHEHTPMVLKQTNAFNKFSGVEVEIVEAISKVMNFTGRYYQSSDSELEKWGRQLLNGSYTGILGEMVNRHADIAIADLQMNSYHLGLMDLSIPHSTECLTFLTPESTTDNSWKTFILPLSGSMWTGVLLSLFLVGSIFYIISCLHRSIIYGKPFENPMKCLVGRSKRTKTSRNGRAGLKIVNHQRGTVMHRDLFDKFSDCLLLTYSMLLQVALPRMPYHWPLRMLTGWYWAYCIQVVVIYRASLTAILANPSPRITIDTLQELADSSLIIAAWGEQNREFFNTAFDETAQKIAINLEQIDDPEKSASRIASGKYAYYDNEYFLRHIRSQRIGNIEENGEVLHIMRECVLRMPISIGLEKNSPLKPNVDKYLRRLIEGGLVDKWLKDTTKNLVAEEQTLPEALMDFKKFWSSLVVLGMGYFVAVLGFIGECLHFKYVVKTHPLYDRYNPRAYYQFKRNGF